MFLFLSLPLLFLHSITPLFPPLKGLYLLDAASFKMKEHFHFDVVRQIIVSSLTDGLVILRFSMDVPNARVSGGLACTKFR